MARADRGYGYNSLLEQQAADDHDGPLEQQGAHDDGDDGLLERQVEEIRAYLAQLPDYGLIDLRWLNGSPSLHVAGQPNRDGGWSDIILGLFQRIGQIAPGSYGLLHLWDDEGTHPNEFRVYRLVRGRLSEHADTLLSPTIPTLEDPEPNPEPDS
ncbi:Imm7 family immunity protein [Nonomuraea aurantiaca]|uniref:Imm7 family immunity protein n=1 Tax=Nonomuraea aurantiaca TaxID=2878562 RepID=UPI001CD9E6F1|nr:Imm7 family immunity protein [Nonomuraea aurantiaca]MCA2229110.1 immunity 7 family protein [Nonomuraea aurantiaca]